MKKDIIIYNAKTLLRGLVRVIWGALNAGLIGLAVYGFTSIPNEGGYVAVCDFIATIAVLVLAFVSVYMLGVGSFQKPRRK
jgi:hypothetical protein